MASRYEITDSDDETDKILKRQYQIKKKKLAKVDLEQYIWDWI